MTATMTDARALLLAVRACLRERCPYGQKPPEGLRLEMHPAVHYTVAQADDLDWEYASVCAAKTPEELLSDKFEVPVKIDPGLPTGHWRLVIVTEDVLLGGSLARGDHG